MTPWENFNAYLASLSETFTKTTLHAFVYKVEEVLDYKEVTLAVVFKIKTSFDKARKATISQTLQTKRAIPTLVSWVRSALQKRNAKAALGDWKVNLLCLIRDGLLERLEAVGFYAQPYTDDKLVLLTGRFLNVGCQDY